MSVPRPDHIHVFPVDDLIEHDTEGDDCVCGPDCEEVEGGWLVRHHSLAGREFAERGEQLPHP